MPLTCYVNAANIGHPNFGSTQNSILVQNRASCISVYLWFNFLGGPTIFLTKTHRTCAIELHILSMTSSDLLTAMMLRSGLVKNRFLGITGELGWTEQIRYDVDEKETILT